MSHVTTGDCRITDLGDVEAALAQFEGARLVRDKKNFKWFGRWVNDFNAARSAVAKGYDTNTFGQCDHVIEVDGSTYEIGIVARPDGIGWDVMYDEWHGQRLEEVFGGKGLPALVAEINMAAATRAAYEQGFNVDRVVNAEGERQLRVWR